MADVEREALLGHETKDYVEETEQRSLRPSRSRFTYVHLLAAFGAGALACLLSQFAICGKGCFESGTSPESHAVDVLAEPIAGSTTVHNFPPPSPTNTFPDLFPSDIGYPGGTPTGGEPGLVATAPSYPLHTGAAGLLQPSTLGDSGSKPAEGFDIFRHWGNLSPWYSVGRSAFGLDSDPGVPDTCRVTGLHFLHRHGARYPTAWASYGGPANFSSRLNQGYDKWNASGQLEFMNDWTYKLGEEVLTPFGRQQLYDLGISLRLKYGFLLENFTETNTIPVFRTESQHRMLHSALNFALGFFGYPLEGKYQQSITIEADGFNNTLAPDKICPNSHDRSKNRGDIYAKEWAEIYLKDVHARLAPLLHGYDLSIEDTYVLQQMCAYETVSIGYSKFCELFTEEEWEGFDYALDLTFWYGSAFGSPTARVLGSGYIQEMLARMTGVPIKEHRFSTNATLDDDSRTFPLDQSLYVDATHEIVILNIITALNLTNFAASGPLPSDHIPKDRSFNVRELAPFATNIQFQLLECSSVPDPQIRIIINDGVSPLTGIRGCPEQKDGMCPLATFIQAQQEMLDEVDWIYDCHGDWSIPDGWQTVTGDSPKF